MAAICSSSGSTTTGPKRGCELWDVAGRTIHCTLIAGHGRDFSAAVDASGEVTFALDRPFSFALYAYRISQ